MGPPPKPVASYNGPGRNMSSRVPPITAQPTRRASIDAGQGPKPILVTELSDDGGTKSKTDEPPKQVGMILANVSPLPLRKLTKRFSLPVSPQLLWPSV